MVSRISVIVPTYNRAHLVRHAIDSVLGQTYNDIELIIADDGSTDETQVLVQRYLERNQSSGRRIQYFYQENQGKSAALNNALLRATGDWIAFLDSDDVWMADKLEWQFKALAKFPECGACYTDCRLMNNEQADSTDFRLVGAQHARDGQKLGKLRNSLESVADSPCGSIITFLCRLDLAQKVGGFDPHLHFTEDYDFIFRLAAVTDFCFVNLPLALADRSAHTERHTGPSELWDRVDFRLRCEQYRYEKWLKMSRALTPKVRKIVLRKLRGVHSSWANWHLQREEYEEARRAIATACSYDVTPSLAIKWLLTCGVPGMMRNVAMKRRIFEDIH